MGRRRQDMSRPMSGAPFRTCQWIDGNDPKTWTYCGKPSVPGYSYCADHKARCYAGFSYPTKRDMALPAFDKKRKTA